MLSKFLQLVSTLEYQEDGWSSITCADWRGSNLNVQVSVRIARSPLHTWNITCERPRSQRILAGVNDAHVSLTFDHVVLWPHVQKQGELYFNGTPVDPLLLLGSLVEAHHDAVGNWFPLHRFLNLPGRRADVFRHGHGLAAKGPIRLLEQYAEVLDNSGVSNSTLPSRDPVWWDGERWVPETEQLHALIVGDSYVVAPRFHETAV